MIGLFEISLAELFMHINKILDKRFESKETFSTSLDTVKRCTNSFYKEIAKKPILIYVEQGTLHTNSILSGNTTKYFKRIIGIENIFNLLFLRNLSYDKQSEIIVKVILYETAYNNIDSIQSLETMIMLDHFIKKTESSTKSGKIDYELLENYFFNCYNKNDLKLFSQKDSKNSIKKFLGIQTSEDKPKYVEQELKFYTTPNAIDLKEFDLKNSSFKYICQYCGNKHPIKLYGYKDESKVNVSNYISFDKQTEKFIFKCDHNSTPYENKDNFGIYNRFNFSTNLTKEQINKIFLFMFFCFKKDGDNIKYFDNQGVEKCNNPTKKVEKND